MKKKYLSLGLIVALSILLLTSCINIAIDKKTKVVDRPIAINFKESPEKIFDLYTEEGKREFKRNFPYKQQLDYALKLIGSNATDFNLTTLNGEKLSFSELKGRKVVINVLKSNCPICQETSHTFHKVSSTIDDVIYISFFPKDDKEKAENYYKQLNARIDKNIVSGLEPENKNTLVTDYGLKVAPTLIFIDESGKISYASQGHYDSEMLIDYFKTAFGDKKLYDLVKTERIEFDKKGNVKNILTVNTKQ